MISLAALAGCGSSSSANSSSGSSSGAASSTSTSGSTSDASFTDQVNAVRCVKRPIPDAQAKINDLQLKLDGLNKITPPADKKAAFDEYRKGLSDLLTAVRNNDPAGVKPALQEFGGATVSLGLQACPGASAGSGASGAGGSGSSGSAGTSGATSSASSGASTGGSGSAIGGSGSTTGSSGSASGGTSGSSSAGGSGTSGSSS